MRGEENVRAECYAKTATWLAEQQVGAVPLIETDGPFPKEFLDGGQCGILTHSPDVIDTCRDSFDPPWRLSLCPRATGGT